MSRSARTWFVRPKRSWNRIRRYCRSREPEKGVDLAFQRQGGDERLCCILLLRLGQHLPRLGVVRLAVEGEAEIARDIVVPRIDQRPLRQLGELGDKGVVELVRMTAVVAVAGAR